MAFSLLYGVEAEGRTISLVLFMRLEKALYPVCNFSLIEYLLIVLRIHDQLQSSFDSLQPACCGFTSMTPRPNHSLTVPKRSPLLPNASANRSFLVALSS